MKVSRVVGPALLGACLYGAVTNSYPTDAEKDAVGDAAATNAVEQAGVAALLGLRTTLGLTEAEIIAAIRAPHTVSQTPPEAARNSERQPWNLRGAWDDDFYFGFSGDWMFPLSTNHLAGVIVHSQGDLSASSCELPFAVLPLAMAMVPDESSFATEFTTSNSYAFSWTQVRPSRLSEEKLNARIELFRNGDYTISTNGCVAEQFVREPPFPHVGIGQDDDWVRANFTNAADILSVGYADWVDAQVGIDLTNGLYKFTATFPVAPPEATELIVGDHSVCVTNAGEYVFVLEKGVEYSFGTNPYDATVEYSMQDDVVPLAPVFTSWWGGVDVGTWTTDGGWHEMCPPTPFGCGTCLWMPTLRGSHDVEHLGPDDFPVCFSAMLTDCRLTNTVDYVWESSSEDIRIESPRSQTTWVTANAIPSWRDVSLSVTATIGSRELFSVLQLTYGRNRTPQVYVSVTGATHVWVNQPADSSNLRHFSARILSDIPTNGTFSASFLGSSEHARVCPTDSWQFDVYEVNTASPDEPYVREFATVEGLSPCDECDEECFAWTFVTPDGVVRAGTNRFTVARVANVDLWSSQGGSSENPPPFPGQELASFRESTGPVPDRHYPVFFCDVADTNMVVQPYSVEYRVATVPEDFSISGARTTLERVSGPESGSLRSAVGKTAYYDTPSEGGIYKVAVKYGDSPKTETVLVLPLAGASVDGVIASDLSRANETIEFIMNNTLPSERQDVSFGLRWFNNNGMGDYLGRVDSHEKPTVWRYNQVNDESGMGSVATVSGVPVRMAKLSNFMVGYATVGIGVSPRRRQLSQLIGNWNDQSATMSWDAGVAVATGAVWSVAVANMVTNAWPVSDVKERRLWPNNSVQDNHTSWNRIVNFNYSFCSPGFMERRP